MQLQSLVACCLLAWDNGCHELDRCPQCNSCVTCRSGSDSLRQIFYALMDLRIHAEYAPGANTTVEQSAVYRDVIVKTSVMPPLPQDRFLNSFTHVFSGGYAAGYYG